MDSYLHLKRDESKAKLAHVPAVGIKFIWTRGSGRKDFHGVGGAIGLKQDGVSVTFIRSDGKGLFNLTHPYLHRRMAIGAKGIRGYFQCKSSRQRSCKTEL